MSADNYADALSFDERMRTIALMNETLKILTEHARGGIAPVHYHFIERAIKRIAEMLADVYTDEFI